MGIRLARGDVLAFTDDDMLVTQGWLGVLLEEFRNDSGQTVVSGGVAAGEAVAPGSFAPSLTVGQNRKEYEGLSYSDVLYTNNMALRRSAFASVGLFDPNLGPGTRFPAGEDNDLGLRLLRAGYRVVFAPDAVAIHRPWRTAQDRFRLRWQYGKGQGAFFAKHLGDERTYMMHRIFQWVRDRVRQARGSGYSPDGVLIEAVSLCAMLTGLGLWVLTSPTRR